MTQTKTTDSVCFTATTNSSSSWTDSGEKITPNLSDMPNEVVEKIINNLPMTIQEVLFKLQNSRLQSIINGIYACKSSITVNLISGRLTYEPAHLAFYWKVIRQSFSRELWHLTGSDDTPEQQRLPLSARQQHWATLKVDESVRYIVNKNQEVTLDRVAQAKMDSQLGPVVTYLPARAFSHVQVRYMTFSVDGLPYVGALLKRLPSSRPIISFQLLVFRSNVYQLLLGLLSCFFSIEKGGEEHSNASRTLRHLSIFVSIESCASFNPSEKDCSELMQNRVYQFAAVEELLIGGIRPRIVKYFLGKCFPALRRLVILTQKEENPTVEDYVEHFSLIPTEVCQQITHLSVRSVKSVRQALRNPVEQMNDPLLVAYVQEHFPAVLSFNDQTV